MTSNPREGLKWIKVQRFLTLPFRAASFKTYLAVNRFEDVPIDQLLDDGIKGVLLDADGTLGPHHSNHFSESVVHHVREMQQRGLKVAIYTNAHENRFSQFEGVSIVTNVPPKPDPKGFQMAMETHLGLNDPSTVCMIGDNYLTDGGAFDAGMRFIFVEPVPGNENPIHKFTRSIARRFLK